MADLDLDIRNYTIKDMEKFFQLSSSIHYTSSDIELKETQIREMLFKSGQVDKKLKRDLIDFLTKAKQWLIAAKCTMPTPASTLPKITQLDRTDPVSQTYGGSISSPTFNLDPNLLRQHYLQKRESVPFVHAMTSEYFSGNMNPLVTRTITKCLTIDTRYRDNISTTSSSDITISLPTKISKVVSMQLASIEIPFSIYGISKTYGNYFLNIELEYANNGGSSVKVSDILKIEEGNYTPADLVLALNNLSIGKQDNDPFKYLVFEHGLNSNGSGTGKTIIQINAVEAASHSIVVTNMAIDNLKNIDGAGDSSTMISSKLGWNLGFTQPRYSGGIHYVSESILNPSISQYLYLAIDDFNNSVNNHFITAFNKSILSPNILARIAIKGDFGKWIIENDHIVVTEPRKYFGPVDIQRLRIQLLDDQGRLMDINNANYSFCLNFKILYDI
jgi:hypothetical protein